MHAGELARQWRTLTRAATVVAALTAIPTFIWFHEQNGWEWWKALLAALALVIAFRGLVDLLFRRAIPWPSLFGSDSEQLREEDVVARRRTWFWRFWLKVGLLGAAIVTVVWLFRGGSWVDTIGEFLSGLGEALGTSALRTQVFFVFFLFISNFAILMGPMLLMGISQIRGF